jgi:2-hydroxy-3-keto-5-methylthiopentenyl-1-phosphate phosphatase
VSNRHKPSLALVLDWDGTVTERDTLAMTIERFGDEKVYEITNGALEHGGMTLSEVITAEIGTVTAPLDEVVAYLLDHVRVRPGFRELVDDYDPLIVSAGFHELIHPILEREGIEARVVANHVSAEPTGWRPSFRESPPCDVCGEPCKRGALPAPGSFVYVGDGFSDRCVSLAATRRFARRGLARWLEGQAVGYEPFDDLHDVARALDTPPREESAGDGRGG